MKKTLTTLAIICLTSLTTLAQTTEGFYISKLGAKTEYAVTLGEKKRPNIGYSYLCKENTKVEVKEDGRTEVITKTLILNKKRKPSKLVGNKDGVFISLVMNADGSYEMGQHMFGQASASHNSTGFMLKIPAEMKVGDEIEGGVTTTSQKMMGITYKQVETYSGFKVVKEEDITTPAGTFHCFLVTGSSLRETKGGDVKCEHEFWFAKGIGLVLWKNYDGYTGLINVELISLSM